MSRFVASLIVLSFFIAPAFAAKDKKKPVDNATTAAPAAPNCPPEPEGMVKMCNGTDLTGWDGNPKFWSVKDGILQGQTTKENPTKGNTFCIWKAGTTGDFDFRCSFKLTGGDSGVQFRSKDMGNWVCSGYQYEINNDRTRCGYLYHEKSPKNREKVLVGDKMTADENGKMTITGSLGDKAAIEAAFKPDDWNECCIIARGNHFQLFVNGVQTADLIDNDPKYFQKDGILALQIHQGGPMLTEFKDLRIKKY